MDRVLVVHSPRSMDRPAARLGWIAGGGAEYMFAPHWTVKAEYLYYDLGSVTYALSPIVQTTATGVPFLGRLLRRTSPSPVILREPV
jgi:hypothetical protein